MKILKIMILGVFGLLFIAKQAEAVGGEMRVFIINQLPAGNVLVIEGFPVAINPGDRIPLPAGMKIILKDSPSDYIKINRIGLGGDEKGGRLMSTCDDSFSNGLGGKCSVSFAK